MVFADCVGASVLPSVVLAAPDDADSWIVEGPRLEIAAMAAFKTTANGGLIPQARHGGRGVEALALPGSKVGGTGLEKEQIGHIQVAFDGGVLEIRDRWNGLLVLETGDEEELSAEVVLVSKCRNDACTCLTGFG